MNDDQIEQMVRRFLAWTLPTDFNPDGDISFVPVINPATGKPYPNTPNGTNLLNYTQAVAMVRHMVAGMAAAQDSAGDLPEIPPQQPFTCGTAHVRASAVLAIVQQLASTANPVDAATIEALNDLVDDAGISAALHIIGDDQQVPF